MKAIPHRTITIGALLCALGLVISLAGLVPSAYAVPCNTNTAPTVTIDPISSPICTGSSVTISGSASDDHGLVSVLVTDSRGNSTSQTLSGTSATWSVIQPISADGLTTVTAKVTDDGVKSSGSAGCTVGSGPAKNTSTTATYTADVSPPAIDELSVGGSRAQGGEVLVNFRIKGGSPNQPFSGTVTLTQGSTSYSTPFSGTFSGLVGSGPTQNEPNLHELISVAIPCDAPLGDYTVTIAVDEANSCGGTYSASDSSESVTIKPGLDLTTTQEVVADFGIEGYGEAQCFSAVAAKTKVNTFPGSFHSATLLTSGGLCVGFDTLSSVTITQTIPPGFKPFTTTATVGTHAFDVTGSGFDLHNPGGEITLSVCSGPNSVCYSVNTVTVNLAGPFAASDTIYVRTHVAQALSVVPGEGTLYTFSSTGSVSTQAGSLSNSGTADLEYTATCVDGQLP